MTARYIIGDVFEALASLPDNSVDLVFSSPPFLALRSYLPADHPLKDKEIGSEATPADFLDTLLDVVEACDRVLAPHGSLCFELGDTFAGSGGAGGDYGPVGLREGQPEFDGSAARTRSNRPGVYGTDTGPPRKTIDDNWPLPKSLCGIPTLFAWSLAYGRNLLRPERILRGPDPCEGCAGTGVNSLNSRGDHRHTECDGTGRAPTRWRIRNVVVWARPNPPVGALGDKFRPATSYLTVACKSDKRWFDLDAVRVPYSEGTLRQYAATADDPMGSQRATKGDGPKEAGEGGWQREQKLTHAGAPPLDYWEIPTQPYPGAHYATFPDKLVVKPVASMCPSKVCRVCGEPSRRLLSERDRFSARQVEFAAWMRETRMAAGVSHADINAAIGRSAIAANYERTDEFGAAIPSPDDWPTVKALVSAGDEFDDLIFGRKSTVEYHRNGEALGDEQKRDDYGRGGLGLPDGTFKAERVAPDRWTDCGHNDWRTGAVLDPFAGSGTTLAVATGHGRDAIGIDIDESNADLALQRVGPLFLTVETLEGTEPFTPPAEDVETDAV